MAKSALLPSLALLALLASVSSENSASPTNSVAELEHAVSTPKQGSEQRAQQNSDQQGGDTRSPVIRKNYWMIFLLGVILLGLVRIAGARREPAILQGTVPPGGTAWIEKPLMPNATCCWTLCL